jgi:hypothetical protein
MMSLRHWLPVVLGATALFASPLDAQRRPSAGTESDTITVGPSRGRGAAAADSLVTPPSYNRQVFTYARFSRVDPVTPPAILAERETFTELSISGILYDARNPRESVAIIRVGNDPKDRRVVRAGDKIGQYTIIEVRRSEVVVDLRMLGSVKRSVITRSDPNAQPVTPSTAPRPTRPNTEPTGPGQTQRPYRPIGG